MKEVLSIILIVWIVCALICFKIFKEEIEDKVNEMKWLFNEVFVSRLAHTVIFVGAPYFLFNYMRVRIVWFFVIRNAKKLIKKFGNKEHVDKLKDL